MDQPSSTQIWKCFGPLIGIFLGFMMGWVLYFISPDSSLDQMTANDVAARTFSLLFSLYGWGLFIVIAQRKKLHCGGTQDLKDGEDPRLGVFCAVSVFFLVVAALLVGSAHFTVYAVVFVLSLGSLAGEIGWGDPWHFIKAFWE